ncbi:hypothetical protein [Paenibacillus pinihumi]|uniref:hypothetical protein n=1 Tax=Paenibacillus pinihumi TaxID=669462 RepID=UPI0004023709|nr:hypothetical protein [Paenibacillus pinihumi]
MKKLIRFSSMVLGVFCLLNFSVSGFVFAESKNNDEIQTIKQIVKQYEQAALEGNWEELTYLSRDLRWPDRDLLEYNLSTMEDKPEVFKLINIVKLEDNLYKTTIFQKSKNSLPLEVEVPVIKENQEWKLVLGQNLDKTNGDFINLKNSNDYYSSIQSYDFYNNYFLTYKEKTPIAALATSVVYYSITFNTQGSRDTSKWKNNSSSPRIIGWQQPDGGHGNWIDIDYSLRTVTFWGSNEISGATKNFKGAYFESDRPWFSHTYSNIPANDTEILLRISNNDNSYRVDIAGNVYN